MILYSDKIKLLNPISYWILGEKSGTTAVDSIGSYDGTINAGITLNQKGLLQSDKTTSMLFNSEQGIHIGTTIATDTFPDKTISFNVKFNDLTSEQVIFKDGDDTNGYAIGITSSELTIGVRSGGVSSNIGYNTSNLNLDQIYNIFAILDTTNSKIQLYIDGMIVIDQLVTISTHNGTCDCAIGTSWCALLNGHRNPLTGSILDERFVGYIQDISVYDYVVSFDDIIDLYNTSIAPKSHKNIVNQLSPIAYYRLGESSGIVADDETGTYPATYVNTPILGATGLMVDDVELNTSVDFTPIGSYLITDTQSSNLALNNVSISATIKISSFPTTQSCLVSFSRDGIDSTLRDKTLELNTNGTISFYTFDGSQKRTTSSPITLNQSTHICGTISDTTNSLYIDGVLVDSTISSGSEQYNSYIIIAGSVGTVGQYTRYNGIIDEVSIFDYALSVYDIYLISNSTKHKTLLYKDAVTSLNPTTYYRFNELVGTVAIDETGNYDGAYINSPTLDDDGLLYEVNDTAVTFNGAGDIHVSVPNIVVNGYTFNTIIKPYETSSIYCIAVLNQTNGYMLFVYGNMLQLYSINTGWINTSYFINPNIQYYITVTSIGTELKIYVDNSFVYEYNSHDLSTTEFSKIGMAYNSIQEFNGIIDEVSLFPRVLSSDELNILYNEYTIYKSLYTSYYNTKAHYAIDEINGSTVAIDSITGNDGVYGSYNTQPIATLGKNKINIGSNGTAGYFPLYAYCEIPVQNDIVGFSCSVRIDTVVQYTGIFSQYINNSTRTILLLDTKGKLSLFINSGYVIHGDDIIADGKDHHIACMWDEFEFSMWVDGVKQSETVDYNPFINDSIHTMYGSYYYSGSYNYTVTPRNLDDLYTFYELSEKGILELYNFHLGKVDIAESTSGGIAYLDIQFNKKETYTSYVKEIIKPNAYFKLNLVAYDEMGLVLPEWVNISPSEQFHKRSAIIEDPIGSYIPLTNRYFRLLEGNANLLAFDSGRMNVSFILKIDSFPSTYQWIIGHGTNILGSDGWRIYIDSTSFNMIYQHNGSILATIPTANFNDGKYHHYTFTYDLVNSKAYIDGILVDTVPNTELISPTTTNLYIGGYTTSYRIFGEIDEVYIMEDTPTKRQINELISLSKTIENEYINQHEYIIQSLNPTAHWKFDDNDLFCKDEKNKYSGNYINSPVVNSNSLTNDRLNKSVLFTNTQYIQIYTVENVIASGTPFSISMLFKQTIGGDSHLINLPYNTGADHFVIFTNALNYAQYGSIAFGSSTTWFQGKIEVGLLNNDQTYHIVLVYDGNDATLSSSFKVYLDGVDSVIVANSGISLEVGTDIYINKRPSTGNNGLTGYIDEVALFDDQALTPLNIVDLFKSTHGAISKSNIISGIKYNEPVRYYNLDPFHFDECLDNSNLDHGVYINSPISQDPIPHYMANYSSCYFDGVDKKITIPEATLNQEFTMIMFINRYDLLDGILIQGTSVSLGIKTNYINVEYTGDHLSSTTLNRYEKYCIAITSSGGSGNIYINGVNSGSFASIPDFNPIEIGSNSYKGIIDNVAFYEYALLESDILELSNLAFNLNEIQYSPDIYTKSRPMFYWDRQDKNGNRKSIELIQGMNTALKGDELLEQKSIIPYDVFPQEINKSIGFNIANQLNIKNVNLVNLSTPFTFGFLENSSTISRNGNFYLTNALHTLTGLTGDGFGIYFYIYLKFEIKIGGLELRVRTTSTYYPVDIVSLFITYDGSGNASGVNMYLNGNKETIIIESDQLSGLDDYIVPSSTLHHYYNVDSYRSNETFWDRELSYIEINDNIMWDLANQINRPKKTQLGDLSREFRVRVDFSGIIHTETIQQITNNPVSQNLDIYDAYYSNGGLGGLTKVNGTGISSKVYIFDKDMNFITSLISESDGTFFTQSVNLNQEYHLVVKSFTGECPQISGLITPTPSTV